MMPISDVELHESFDAYVWADRWMEVIAAHPGVATDRETMMGWFANALMAGYDHAKREMPGPGPDPTPHDRPQPPLPGGPWADV